MVAAGTAVDANGCPLPAQNLASTESAEVTATGTWLCKDIQFENNSASLRETSFANLNEVVQALREQPSLNIEIQGHTDSSGARAYNLSLSRKRAEAVKAYLVNKGIDAEK